MTANTFEVALIWLAWSGVLVIGLIVVLTAYEYVKEIFRRRRELDERIEEQIAAARRRAGYRRTPPKE